MNSKKIVRLAAWVATACAASALAACNGTSLSQPTPATAFMTSKNQDSTQAFAKRPVIASSGQSQLWILAGPGNESQDMATDPEGIAFFSNPSRTVLYPAKAAVPPPPAWNVITWQKYASFASFQAAVAGGTVPAGVAIVAYDDESWSFTPANEKSDPIGYTIKFAQLAHANGFKFIAMPAEDLMYALVPGTTDKFAAFIKYGMAGAVAPYVDYFHIQSQDLEESTPAYVSYIQTIVGQVQAANPSVAITGGITTVVKNQPTVTAANIDNAVTATSGILSGYWLNIVGATTPIASAALSGLGN